MSENRRHRGQVACETTPLTLALAAEMRAERAALGLTQEQAAERAGLVLDTYKRIDKGARPATTPQLERVARGFGMAPSALLARAEDRVAREQAPASVVDRQRIPDKARASELELEMILGDEPTDNGGDGSREGQDFPKGK